MADYQDGHRVGVFIDAGEDAAGAVSCAVSVCEVWTQLLANQQARDIIDHQITTILETWDEAANKAELTAMSQTHQ